MKKGGSFSSEQVKFRILAKLIRCQMPLTFADFGSFGSPQVIRNLAARGMIDVKITIKARGLEEHERLVLDEKKRERRAQVKAMAEAA